MDDFAEPDKTRVKTQLIADHGDAFVLVSEIDEFLGAHERVCKWFFEEDVTAGNKTGTGYDYMQTAGVTDVGDVRPFAERLVKRGKGADIVDILDVAFLVSAHGWSDDVGEPPDAVGDNFDRIAE